jgi:hypothetical protein
MADKESIEYRLTEIENTLKFNNSILHDFKTSLEFSADAIKSLADHIRIFPIELLPKVNNILSSHKRMEELLKSEKIKDLKSLLNDYVYRIGCTSDKVDDRFYDELDKEE